MASHKISTFGFSFGDYKSHYALLENLARKAGICRCPNCVHPWDGITPIQGLVLVAADAVRRFEEVVRSYTRNTGLKPSAALFLRAGEKKPQDTEHVVDTTISTGNLEWSKAVLLCPEVVHVRQIVNAIPISVIQFMLLSRIALDRWPADELPIPLEYLVHADSCSTFYERIGMELWRRSQTERSNLTTAREIVFAAMNPKSSPSVFQIVTTHLEGLAIAHNKLMDAAINQEMAQHPDADHGIEDVDVDIREIETVRDLLNALGLDTSVIRPTPTTNGRKKPKRKVGSRS